MSLATRIAAAITLLVGTFALLGWFAAHRTVVRPLVGEVFDRYVAEVAFVGERMERGANARELGRKLDLKIRPHTRPIPPHWREDGYRGRRVWVAPGLKRSTMVVETSKGMFAVSSELDLGRPGQRLPFVFLTVAVVVILIAFAIARRGLAPLKATTTAMGHMAAGHLDHRLDVSGPTELAAAASAFNVLADRIEGLLETERQLMAGISHELRTPLTRLTLEIELLRDAGVPEARLQRMLSDTRQMDDLVGETLALSRLQLGDTPLAREATDLRALAEGVSCEGRAVTITGHAIVHCDPILVGRAMHNLIHNADKYTPPDCTIEVQVDATGFTVRDTGPGVDPASLDSLFEPFFRTKSGSERSAGHGLGLMIVRQVAALHGGSVSAHNANPGLAVRVDLTAT